MRKAPKIMVIDDEFDITFIVRRYLERWGFSVDTFTNPLYALEQFKKNPSTYSVVLTADIRMPEISGVELAARMLKINPNAKIVIMTAFEISAPELKLSLPKISDDGILKKPFKLMQVCTAVKKQLQTA